MQGVLINEKGGYVKAALVKVFKIKDLPEDSEDKEEEVTYTLTDESGRFVIRELDPEGNYTFEILTARTDQESVYSFDTDFNQTDENDSNPDENSNPDESSGRDENSGPDQITSFANAQYSAEAVLPFLNQDLTGISYCSGLKADEDLKSKLYSIKNYTW